MKFGKTIRAFTNQYLLGILFDKNFCIFLKGIFFTGLVILRQEVIVNVVIAAHPN